MKKNSKNTKNPVAKNLHLNKPKVIQMKTRYKRTRDGKVNDTDNRRGDFHPGLRWGASQLAA